MEPESPHIILTADIIIEQADGRIVLVKRANPPFQGQWALPGGMLDGNESIQEAAVREALEETGLQVMLTGIVGVYSKAGRDPRGRYVSVAFTATPVGGELHASSDAREAVTTRDFASFLLAFDHNEILTDYLNQKKK